MTRSRRRWTSGVTLIEVVLFGAIAAGAMLAVSALIKRSGWLQQVTLSDQQEREMSHAIDGLIKDLKEADPASVAVSSDPSGPEIHFFKAHYNVEKQNYEPFATVQYHYESDDSRQGTVFRREKEIDQPLLRFVSTPNPSQPMFQFDSSLSIVTISIRYAMPGKAIVRAVRRVALRE
jgi:hypothetical protein